MKIWLLMYCSKQNIKLIFSWIVFLLVFVLLQKFVKSLYELNKSVIVAFGRRIFENCGKKESGYLTKFLSQKAPMLSTLALTSKSFICLLNGTFWLYQHSEMKSTTLLKLNNKKAWRTTNPTMMGPNTRYDKS